ncbi:MAG: hypothetical protein GQ535_11275 [Rhodobacteraceae bacterium]|nr:hypothetical protein [Paracoccaceae bacterium]
MEEREAMKVEVKVLERNILSVFLYFLSERVLMTAVIGAVLAIPITFLILWPEGEWVGAIFISICLGVCSAGLFKIVKKLRPKI